MQLLYAPSWNPNNECAARELRCHNCKKKALRKNLKIRKPMTTAN